MLRKVQRKYTILSLRNTLNWKNTRKIFTYKKTHWIENKIAFVNENIKGNIRLKVKFRLCTVLVIWSFVSKCIEIHNTVVK